MYKTELVPPSSTGGTLGQAYIAGPAITLDPAVGPIDASGNLNLQSTIVPYLELRSVTPATAPLPTQASPALLFEGRARNANNGVSYVTQSALRNQPFTRSDGLAAAALVLGAWDAVGGAWADLLTVQAEVGNLAVLQGLGGIGLQASAGLIYNVTNSGWSLYWGGSLFTAVGGGARFAPFLGGNDGVMLGFYGYGDGALVARLEAIGNGGPGGKRLVLDTAPLFTPSNAAGAALGSLTYYWSETVTQHLVGAAAAVPTLAGGTGAGAAAVLSVTGTDLSGTISITTDVADTPAANADILTLSFNVAYGAAPRVQITPANDAAWDLAYGTARYRQADTAVGSFKLRSGAVPLPPLTAATYLFNYEVSQ